MPRIGRLEAITPRQLLAMVTANAAEHFCRDQLGGVATPAAGQPQSQLDPSKAWAAAGGAGPGDSAYEAEGQRPDRGHAGGVEVGAHVGFH